MEPTVTGETGLHIGFDLGNRPRLEKQPLNVWLVGEFTPDTKSTRPIKISLATLEEQLSDIVGSVAVPLNHKLIENDARNGYLTIPVRTLSDFKPSSIAANIPSLKPYTSLLTLFLQRKYNQIDKDHFTNQLGSFHQDLVSHYYQPHIASEHTSDNAEFALKPKATADVLSSLIDFEESNRLRDSAPGSATSESGNTNQLNIDNAITKLKHDIFPVLENIYNAREFSIIEKNWLALAKILKQQNTKNTSVHIVNAHKEETEKTLTRCMELSTSETRPVMAALAFGFDNSTRDISLLNDIALVADQFHLPVSISLEKTFFEKTPRELSTIDNLNGVLEQAQFDGWNALRNKEHARWLCASFNDFMVREPYHTENNRELEFNAQQAVWGNSGLMIALLVVKSIAKFGWPTEVAGLRNGLTTDMPLTSFDHPLLGEMFVPLATVMDEERQEVFNQAGVTVLQCVPNREQIFISHAPMLVKYRKYNDRMVNLMNQKMHDLAYQLLGATIIPCVSSVIKKSFNRQHPSAVKENLEDALHEFIADTGAGAKADVQLMIDPDKPSTLVATITIKTGKKILNGSEIEFSIEI